jgi:hypothetical protein
MIPLKPGEFSCDRAGGAASIGPSKAPDIIYDPVRVGKGVAMSAFLLGPLVRMRKGVTASAAEDQLLFPLYRIAPNRLFRTPARQTRSRFVAWQAKPIEDTAVGRVHDRCIP